MRVCCRFSERLVGGQVLYLILAIIEYEANTSASMAVFNHARPVPYPGIVYFIPVFHAFSRRKYLL